jgi:hypothetical protein
VAIVWPFVSVFLCRSVSIASRPHFSWTNTEIARVSPTDLLGVERARERPRTHGRRASARQRAATSSPLVEQRGGGLGAVSAAAGSQLGGRARRRSARRQWAATEVTASSHRLHRWFSMLRPFIPRDLFGWKVIFR